MTVVRVEWGNISSEKKQMMQMHLIALENMGATVVDSNADDNVQSVIDVLLQLFRSRNMKAGDVVPEKALVQLKLPNSELNPIQQRAIPNAIDALVAQKLLSLELGQHRLTTAGEKFLYSDLLWK